MKYRFLTWSCAAALTCSTAATAMADTAVDAFVGKQIVSERGTIFEYKADGTIGGLLGGKSEITGTYTADAEKTCNTYTAPPPLVGGERCSIPRVDGSTVVFVRDDGSESAPYTIK